MATRQELNTYYKSIFNKDFPAATLSRWTKAGKLRYERKGRGYDYNFDDFKEIINSSEYRKKVVASTVKPEDYIGTTCCSLLITGVVPKEDYQENYSGSLMYCTCLECGKQNVQVRLSYLTGNGNYTQETCGCKRKERAFLATSRKDIPAEFLENFSSDFDKFLFVHKMLVKTTDCYYFSCAIDEYKEAALYFFNDKQFNAIYSFWQNNKRTNNTFYDWAKPSLDHIIPRSKGGTNKLQNLQTLTVFENLAKRDMTQEEWQNFKKITNTCSDYFVENIMREGEY